jgi:rhodanese-related sulfurtransferase
MDRGMKGLSAEGFEAAANETSALVLDTRDPETFAKGFIPGSINIGVNGSFARWVGALIPDIKQEILLVTEPGAEEEVITRLARVGYDNAIGFLDGGITTWIKAGREIDSIKSISPQEFEKIFKEDSPLLIDVRKPGEYEAEHVEGVKHIALDYINDHMAEFTHDQTQYIHCAGGYRSMIASSILKARGFDNVVNIQKGFKGMKETDLPFTNYVCPTTLKK